MRLSDTEQGILDTVGTFRMGAEMQSDDVRFASLCDGHDLSDIEPRTLTRVLRMRCNPVSHPDTHFPTGWVRRW